MDFWDSGRGIEPRCKRSTRSDGEGRSGAAQAHELRQKIFSPINVIPRLYFNSLVHTSSLGWPKCDRQLMQLIWAIRTCRFSKVKPLSDTLHFAVKSRVFCDVGLEVIYNL